MLDDSKVVYEDEEGPITQADLQRWFVDDWDKRAPVKVSTDGCTNDFLMVGLSTKDMPPLQVCLSNRAFLIFMHYFAIIKHVE